MRTRSAWVLRLSAALLSLTPAGLALAQAPANIGRQLEGQVLNNVGNAVTGRTAPVVPGQPGAMVPGQPAGLTVPTTPGQALQGMERQAINNATSAVTGQPAAMATSGARYQLPAQFAASAPGTTVSYNGANYVVNANRTMSPATAMAAATQPAANAVRYQLPAQFAGSAPGTTISYGGANYVVNANRTMSPVAAAAQPAAVQPSPAATRYLIPADLAGSGPGSTASYGGASYVINNDNTMSPAPR